MNAVEVDHIVDCWSATYDENTYRTTTGITSALKRAIHEFNEIDAYVQHSMDLLRHFLVIFLLCPLNLHVLYTGLVSAQMRAELDAADPAWDNRIRFSDLEYKSTQVQLGDLAGNHFTIALRGIPCAKADVVALRLQALRHRGFLNYFGLAFMAGAD